MRITVDTNVLVRVVVRDDQRQADAAEAALRLAALIAIKLPAICEFVRVLRQVYGLGVIDLALAVERVIAVEDVLIDRNAVAAGLSALRSGADFADGVIAYEGRRMGGKTFVSFDRKAVALVRAQGFAAALCGELS